MTTNFVKCFLAIALALSMIPNATAQEVEVQVATEEPPHYVGVPAVVQLTVEGLEGKPEPQCKAESDSPDVRVRLSGMSPRVVQQIIQNGNQIRRIQQVTYIIQFRVTANKPGEHEIGPFVISQGGTEERVDAIKMSFKEVPTTDDLRIKLSMPATAYPDQRVPVAMELWYAGDTENVLKWNIDAALFDQFPFAPDRQPRRGELSLPIQTSKGEIRLVAQARQEVVDDKTFTVISAERTLVPNRPGKHELEPIAATIEKVTQWQQRRRSAMDGFGFGGSIFEEAFGGSRRPAKVELFRALGNPLVFEVKPFPNSGRPESFAGAVGKGFRLDVTADRTVVRVGDPIRLTLNLRGDGNIEGATLPALSADGGLNPELFRLPDGDVAGVVKEDQDAKQFVVSVRVLDEAINEIPAIAYSWFDAEKESYQTTRSKPIALRVMPAQVVGADAVVSNQPPRSETDVQPGSSNERNAETAPRFSLSGADLAIETNPSRLLTGASSFLSSDSFQVVGYGLGSFCVLLALVDYRRRQVDPSERNAANVIRDQRSRVASASGLPEQDAAKQIADALRLAAAEYPNHDRDSIQTIVVECEAIAYRPTSDRNAKIESQLVDRALAAIGELKQGARSE